MKAVAIVLVSVGLTLSVCGQEMGRAPLSSGGKEGLGRAPLPRERIEGSNPIGDWSLKAGLGWANVRWDIGSASGSDSTFAPQAALQYRVADNLDIAFSGLFLSGEDNDSEYGDNEISMGRLSLGLCYWLPTDASIMPYVGAGLGYYLLDGDTGKAKIGSAIVDDPSVELDDSPGAYFQGGLAFKASEGVFVTADLMYDVLLGSANATLNDEDQDLELSAVSVSLSVMWMF